jgi:hypothetical protein
MIEDRTSHVGTRVSEVKLPPQPCRACGTRMIRRVYVSRASRLTESGQSAKEYLGVYHKCSDCAMAAYVKGRAFLARTKGMTH